MHSLAYLNFLYVYSYYTIFYPWVPTYELSVSFLFAEIDFTEKRGTTLQVSKTMRMSMLPGFLVKNS